MTVTHIVGVDPGLVHTGVVRLVFEPAVKEVLVEHEAIEGPQAWATREWIHHGGGNYPYEPRIFIEKYQPRSHFGTDAAMAQALADMRRAMPKATVLLNTGVKKVVKPPLMQLLKVWQFPTVTNHDDLRSAARIALLGMLKSEPLNRLLADMVRDHLNGGGWDVRA